MNSLTKKMLLIGATLLLCACAHDSQQYVYYPSDTAYSSGYTIMHRNYYGERPEYYDNGYRQGRDYFPHHHHHDQYSVRPRWGDNYQDRKHQHDKDRDHNHNHDHANNDDNNRLKYENVRRQHNDGHDWNHNNHYRRDYHY
jgi:hypothetical protein